MRNRRLEKFLDLCIVLCGITTLVFYSGAVESKFYVERFAAIYAIDMCLATVYYLLEFIYIRKRSRGVFFSLLKYIVLTLMTFCTIFSWVFMQPFYRNASENMQYAYLGMHCVMPILIVLEYLVGEKGHFNKKFIITNMALLIIYGGVVLLCGQYAHTGYPYAFLDPEQLGYSIVLKECALICVVYYFYSKLILMFDHRFKKRKRKTI